MRQTASAPLTSVAPPAQRTSADRPELLDRAPFSALVLVRPASPLATRITTAMRAAGAREILLARSAADLLRNPPAPAGIGVGVICGSSHAAAVRQLVGTLRKRGWRRIAVTYSDAGEAAIRLAMADRVRCLVRGQELHGDPAPPPQSPGADHLALSIREVQVLQAVADGRTNNEVGTLLGVSGLTVKSHLARIGRKTGTGDRAEMIAIAMRAGLVH